MTDFSDFKAQIAEWSNRQDWSDALVTSFVRMAESKLNQELRVALMIQMDDGIITSRCAQLPDDWLAMDLVRVANENGADGFLPARYKARDEFFNQTRQPHLDVLHPRRHDDVLRRRRPTRSTAPNTSSPTTAKSRFSPTRSTSWVYTKYPNLYLSAAMMHAYMHAVGEEQNAANSKQLAEDMIQKLNAAHLGAKASGSRVTRPRHRSFG